MGCSGRFRWSEGCPCRVLEHVFARTVNEFAQKGARMIAKWGKVS